MIENVMVKMPSIRNVRTSYTRKVRPRGNPVQTPGNKHVSLLRYNTALYDMQAKAIRIRTLTMFSDLLEAPSDPLGITRLDEIVLAKLVQAFGVESVLKMFESESKIEDVDIYRQKNGQPSAAGYNHGGQDIEPVMSLLLRLAGMATTCIIVKHIVMKAMLDFIARVGWRPPGRGRKGSEDKRM